MIDTTISTYTNNTNLRGAGEIEAIQRLSGINPTVATQKDIIVPAVKDIATNFLYIFYVASVGGMCCPRRGAKHYS